MNRLSLPTLTIDAGKEFKSKKVGENMEWKIEHYDIKGNKIPDLSKVVLPTELNDKVVDILLNDSNNKKAS